jgi:hypothetical protein
MSVPSDTPQPMLLVKVLRKGFAPRYMVQFALMHATG